MDDSAVIINLKIGIMKDLCNNGLVTQSQMKQAITKLLCNNAEDVTAARQYIKSQNGQTLDRANESILDTIRN